MQIECLDILNPYLTSVDLNLITDYVFFASPRTLDDVITCVINKNMCFVSTLVIANYISLLKSKSLIVPAHVQTFPHLPSHFLYCRLSVPSLPHSLFFESDKSSWGSRE